MTSSRLEPPTQTTGAHRAQRRTSQSDPRTDAGGAQRTVTRRPPARYEPYLDGLFTYCLSVLCDHDAATAVLGDVLAVAERQSGRCPDGETERRAWLYALARWACLRELAEQRRKRQGAHAARTADADDAPRVPDEVAQRRRRELSLLAWPEAAGTTPEQREALELAVRHQLGAPGVAAVLGMTPLAARELLSAAACEVERTRAALAVVETGVCPAVARLTGNHQVLLSAALRRELVRHVDDCPRCRRAAERAGAGGPWPGSSVTPENLPLVEAPRTAACVLMPHVSRPRAGGPRFGRDGFPLDPKDHAARRDRLRARAVTTTVVATVVAAPVLALWAAYRGDSSPRTDREGPAVSAADTGDETAAGDRSGRRYENTGNARIGGPRLRDTAPAPDVSVEVISAGTPARPGQPGPGRITVAAQPYGDTTLLTLTASGGSPVAWSLWSDAPWLYASRSSGTLHPGESLAVYVSVDRAREPQGPWSARVGVNPAGAVVEIDGHGPKRPSTQKPKPTSPKPTTPRPSDPGPGTSPSPGNGTTPPPSSPAPDPSQPPTTPPPSSDPPPQDTPAPTEDPSTPAASPR
ncbi:hypothetical protein [Streptomyces sp. NPDC047928]|uniref:BACON domain-containing protein n=1 Tax=unclassified Streptomyces TaxID=2593676 RepID=UPI0037135B47